MIAVSAAASAPMTTGTIDARQDGIGITNPNETEARVVLADGDEIVTMVLAPRASRVVRMDRLFVKQAEQTVTFNASQPVLAFAYNANGATPAAAVIPSRRHAVRFPAVVAPPVPQTVVLTPSKDATLYQTIDGTLANGSGVHIFAGTTNSFEMRRALMAFDLESKIPPGSQITGVKLAMHVSTTIAGNEFMELHRVTTDWGEGPSDAGSARDGQGVASKNGDATWIHTFFPNQRWTNAGGDFASSADATAGVAFGGATWVSNAALVGRVQGWIDQPSTNFGWILLGNESTSGTTKRFDSREVATETARPTLTVDFMH
jgi:hypothetical protein